MDPIRPPHPMLTMLEGRAAMEAAGLMLSLPLLRLQARRGNGEPVIVLPGFMADDRSTYFLRAYLTAIGYAAAGWGLGLNRRPLVEYLPLLKDQLKSAIDEARDAPNNAPNNALNNAPMKVRLVGWSRGGMIARELAREFPELVDRVVTVGTPVKGGVAASSISRWVQRETGLTPEQMNKLLEERQRTPIRVPVRALYSRTDGVVAWRACIDDSTPDIEHYEIWGSHVGMGSNVEVFKLIPKLLAEKI